MKNRLRQNIRDRVGQPPKIEMSVLWRPGAPSTLKRGGGWVVYLPCVSPRQRFPNEGRSVDGRPGKKTRRLFREPAARATTDGRVFSCWSARTTCRQHERVASAARNPFGGRLERRVPLRVAVRRPRRRDSRVDPSAPPPHRRHRSRTDNPHRGAVPDT